MSKFFDRTHQDLPEAEAEKHPLAMPGVDDFLTELQETVDTQVPMVQLPTNLRFKEALEDFKDSVPEGKIRHGAGEYRRVSLRPSSKLLLSDHSLTDAASDSYRGIRTRLMQQRANGEFHVAAVTSAVQGEGKTLTAINLAFCCSRLSNFRVLLVDADLRTSGCSHALGVGPGPGLAEVLTSVVTCSEAIAQTDQPNLYILGAGEAKVPPPELFADSAWAEFIAWVGNQFDLVIVDAPPVLPVPDFELIGAACQRVMVVARPFLTRNEQLESTLARIERAKFAGVILNGAAAAAGNYYYNQESSSKGPK